MKPRRVRLIAIERRQIDLDAQAAPLISWPASRSASTARKLTPARNLTMTDPLPFLLSLAAVTAGLAGALMLWRYCHPEPADRPARGGGERAFWSSPGR